MLSFNEKLMQIETVNADLKRANIRVKVLQRGGSLYLQATLPPKPGEAKNKQRQIALGVPASTQGLKIAKAKALELSAQLTMKQFRWSDWEKVEGKTGDRWIIKDAMDQFRKDYERTHNIHDETWHQFWWHPAFKRLPPEMELTPGVIVATVLKIQPNTWTRNRACEVLQRFCDWAGVEVDLKPFRCKSKKREIKPPPKELVEECYQKVLGKWKVVYARIAIFGLRPHEAFFFERRGELEGYVREGKTGAREVLAVFPKWAREWELEGDLPNITWTTYADIGKRCNDRFCKDEIPFSPYELRHAAAIEFSVVRGAPLKLAALQFGHSEEIHLKTYTKWLDSAHLRAAYERIMRDG